MTMFDLLPILDRIGILRERYCRTTGVFPTKLIMRPIDFYEFEQFRHLHGVPTYLAPPQVPEPEFLGMTFQIEPYAKEMSVLFKES